MKVCVRPDLNPEQCHGLFTRAKMGKRSGGSVSIILTTERLCLRRIEGADLPSLGKIYADPECMRFSVVLNPDGGHQNYSSERYATRDGFLGR